MRSSVLGVFACSALAVLAFGVGCGGSDSTDQPGLDQDSAVDDSTATGDDGTDSSIDDSATSESSTDGEIGSSAEAGTDSAADTTPADTAIACDTDGGCPGELTCCGSLCVDTQSSAAHCGGCGTSCTSTGETCAEGSCACPGPFGGVCSGACVDLTKPPNCGTCGTTCTTDKSCAIPAAPAAPGCGPTCFSDLPSLDVPGTTVHVGYSSAWGTGRSFAPTAGDRGAILFDDATGKIASVLANVPAVGADAAAEVTRIRGLVKPALGTGTTDVTLAIPFTSHEGNAATTTIYAVARSTNASDLRDAVAAAVLGEAPPAPTAKLPTATTFLVTLTTVYRAGGRTDVMIAIAPRTDAESRTGQTIWRIGDLTNTTAMADKTKTGGFACQLFSGASPQKVDIIWTIDTSGSMSDDQDRIGRAGKGIFDRLRLAGLDFRMAVVNAGSTTFNIDTPGLTWISGTDPTGPDELCRRVTYLSCSITAAETKVPYPFGGSSEEPTAAAVIAHNTLFSRGKAGETNPDKRLRDGARVVTFHVTDEPGSNDFSRYFTSTKDPQLMTAWGATYNATTLANIVDYFVRNQIITFGILPPMPAGRTCASLNVADMHRCVVEANSGTVIDITTATEAQIEAAFGTIGDLVGATVSPYKLSKWPISSSIVVRVNGTIAPRSRNDGWDFDAATRSIAWYGSTTRPKKGDEIVVEARTWD